MRVENTRLRGLKLRTVSACLLLFPRTVLTPDCSTEVPKRVVTIHSNKKITRDSSFALQNQNDKQLSARNEPNRRFATSANARRFKQVRKAGLPKQLRPKKNFEN